MPRQVSLFIVWFCSLYVQGFAGIEVNKFVLQDFSFNKNYLTMRSSQKYVRWSNNMFRAGIGFSF